ncbi:MAG: MFS transporter, partial [Pseudomonadota bacterium]
GRVVSARGLDQLAHHTAEISKEEDRRSWTRAEVLKDPRFFALLPGLLAPPFIITGVLFHQVHLVETKFWSLSSFAACYPLYAASAVVVTLVCGRLVDRYGSVQLLPYYLLPLAAGLALLAMSDAFLAAPVFMLLIGATAGGTTVVLGALWAELYGTAHLGAIRSLSYALLVLSTAIAPGLMGWLIDHGVSLDAQFLAYSVYAVICALTFSAMRPSLMADPSPPETYGSVATPRKHN